MARVEQPLPPPVYRGADLYDRGPQFRIDLQTAQVSANSGSARSASQLSPLAPACPTISKAGRRPIGLDEVTETPSGSTRQKEPLLRQALSGVTDKRAFSGSGAAAKADSGPGSGSAHLAAKAPDTPALRNVSLTNRKQSRRPSLRNHAPLPLSGAEEQRKQLLTPARKYHVKTEQQARHPCSCCC